MTQQEVEVFFAACPWQSAKTMPEMPHEYVLRFKLRGPARQTFYEVVTYIREHGYQRTFGGRAYTYFDAGGFRHWTMGSPVADTILINRARLEGC